ncbi:Hypothetical predicted protein, partial [Lynx pardinus]
MHGENVKQVCAFDSATAVVAPGGAKCHPRGREEKIAIGVSQNFLDPTVEVCGSSLVQWILGRCGTEVFASYTAHMEFSLLMISKASHRTHFKGGEK